jgi:hypothetical protein
MMAGGTRKRRRKMNANLRLWFEETDETREALKQIEADLKAQGKSLVRLTNGKCFIDLGHPFWLSDSDKELAAHAVRFSIVADFVNDPKRRKGCYGRECARAILDQTSEGGPLHLHVEGIEFKDVVQLFEHIRRGTVSPLDDWSKEQKAKEQEGS